MSKIQKFKHCQDCPSLGKGIFCELEGMAMDELSSQKITNTFKKGQTLFVQGSPPYGLYCVSTGNIKITKASNEGKEAIVRIATAGDILGHRSIFSGDNFSATATAMEDSSVCFVDKKYIMKMVQEHPSVACKLITSLGKDLGASETKVASFSQRNVFERTCEVLLLLKESHGVEQDGKTLLDIKMTREEMASVVGTATETLIRILSELKSEGLVEQQGKSIILTNSDKILEYANIGV